MNQLRLLAVFLFASFLYLACNGQPVFAEGTKPVHIEVDASVLGYEPSFSYKIVKDRLLVQAAAFLTAIDAAEAHDPHWNTVTISKDGKRIQLTAGVPVAHINGKNVTMEVAPELVKGELLIPLRATSQALGVDVEWNPAYRAAILSTQQRSPGIVDKQMLSLAKEGRVKAIPFSLGSSRQQIEQAWGKPFDSYYYEGGKFFAYQSCSCSVFYDQHDQAAIFDLPAKKIGVLRAEDVRRILGKPKWEEESATHSEYLLNYPIGEYALTFFSTFREGSIMSLWLQKQHLDS
ncbi:stalk domain-containing protein [Brevibacillus migulae]|uniref:stalk domain-containing protein n=1 Tax=Brevibacillus migulae TaxID=1644114 RepID=UPI001431602D|nr:stalk domain-containing protein [Brevibacillus migulae]